MCQKMLWRGVAYLAEVRPPLAMWEGAKTYENVYGVMVTEGHDLKALEEAIIKPGDDVTGAMHQAVMGHLAYIHAHGTEAWIDTVVQARGEAAYEWEGEIA